MALFDIFRPQGLGSSDVASARTALQEARGAEGSTDAMTATIQRILALGLDGRGFYKGAAAVADRALASSGGDVEAAIGSLSRGGVRAAAGGGFVTSLGGFVTMPVAIPVNVLEFYITATRTVGAIAKLRGYDITDPTVRTAVLLTLAGSKSTDILSKAGVTMGGGVLGGLAKRRLPEAAVMMINKAVGFRLLRALGQKTLARFGRAVPLLGGAVGAFADGAMMSEIAQQAREEFPRYVSEKPRDWGVR